VVQFPILLASAGVPINTGNAAIRESRRLVSDQRQHNKEALNLYS